MTFPNMGCCVDMLDILMALRNRVAEFFYVVSFSNHSSSKDASSNCHASEKMNSRTNSPKFTSFQSKYQGELKNSVY